MKHLFILLIKGYQKALRPLLGSSCRFYPSCSDYAQEALREKSFFKALYLIVKRLLKCNPFHPGGHDPIEPENKKV